MRADLRVACVALAITAGCLFPSLDSLSGDGGTTDSAADVPAHDALVDSSADAAGDVQVDAAARCNPASPFGVPTQVPGAIDTSVDEVVGRYSADELTIVFCRTAANDAGQENYHLFFATRPTPNDDFGTATPITELNSTAGDYDPFLLSDNLTLYFASDRPNGYSERIYVAKRPTPTSPFGAPTVVTALDVSNAVGQIFFLPDGATAYFADLANSVIYTTAINQGAFGLPQKVPLSLGDVTFPSLTGDALTLFVGNNQVFSATRASTSNDFGALSAVSELSSTATVNPTWVSADGCVLLLQSNALGDYDMLVAKRGF